MKPGLQRVLLVAAAVVVAAVAYWTFAPTLSGEFLAFDDDQNILQNEAFRGFAWKNLAWMVTTRRMGHWQPLTWLSLAADHAIAGLDPAQFHRTNVILHALNAVLVLALVLRLLGVARPRSAPVACIVAATAAALVFAVHPLRVESVAWVTERRDVLSAFFLLAAAVAWTFAVRRGEPVVASRRAYVLVLVLLFCSVLAKAWGMTFFVVLLVLDVWPFVRVARVRDVLGAEKIPFAVVGAVAAGIAAWAVRSAPDVVKSLGEWSVAQRLGQAIQGLVYYPLKTFVPLRLTPIHELPRAYDPLDLATVASLAALVAAVGVIVAVRRQCPALAVGAFCYGVLVSPVLGLVQSGPQFVADRYSYIACVPFAAAFGALVLVAADRDRRRTLATVAVVLVAVGLMIRSSRAYCAAWHDTRALWTHALTVAPSSLAHQGLGTIALDEGRFDDAFREFTQAVEVRPDNGGAWLGLGNAQRRRGELEAAERSYAEGEKFVFPRYLAYVSLANLYLANLHRVDDGIAMYRAAVADVERLGGEWFTPMPYLYLGIALLRRGDAAAARPFLETAARSPRTRAQALELLGR